jgi:hypothetical protein
VSARVSYESTRRVNGQIQTFSFPRPFFISAIGLSVNCLAAHRCIRLCSQMILRFAMEQTVRPGETHSSVDHLTSTLCHINKMLTLLDDRRRFNSAIVRLTNDRIRTTIITLSVDARFETTPNDCQIGYRPILHHPSGKYNIAEQNCSLHLS